MGANQSDESRVGQTSSQQHSNILVVNSRLEQQQREAGFPLPKRVPPVLSLEGHHIDPNRHKPGQHQLDPDLWADLVKLVNDCARSRSELAATRQGQLQEKIVQIDEHVQQFTKFYVNGKHKALARMSGDCKRMDEIEKQLQKCTTQAELCVSVLNKLNFLLPDDQKLEPLEL